MIDEKAEPVVEATPDPVEPQVETPPEPETPEVTADPEPKPEEARAKIGGIDEEIASWGIKKAEKPARVPENDTDARIQELTQKVSDANAERDKALSINRQPDVTPSLKQLTDDYDLSSDDALYKYLAAQEKSIADLRGRDGEYERLEGIARDHQIKAEEGQTRELIGAERMDSQETREGHQKLIGAMFEHNDGGEIVGVRGPALVKIADLALSVLDGSFEKQVIAKHLKQTNDQATSTIDVGGAPAPKQDPKSSVSSADVDF